MSFLRNNKNKLKVVYNIINISENTKDKECIEADNENEKKYRKTMARVTKETKKWENTGVSVSLNLVPPPTPNNYDRLIDFRKKNVLRPAILQSEATIYLNNKNYILGKDYEAYQAIEVAGKLRNYEKQTVKNNEEKFKNNLLNDDNVNLDILNLNPNLERKRNRTKSLVLHDNYDFEQMQNYINDNNKNKKKNKLSKRERSKSLSSNKSKNLNDKQNKYLYNNGKPTRSYSLDNNNKNFIDIDEVIEDFDNKGKVNNTQKEDLYPKTQGIIAFPSPPSGPIPSAPSAPSTHSTHFYPNLNNNNSATNFSNLNHRQSDGFYNEPREEYIVNHNPHPQPSAPPRQDDTYYPRKESIDESCMC